MKRRWWRWKEVPLLWRYLTIKQVLSTDWSGCKQYQQIPNVRVMYREPQIRVLSRSWRVEKGVELGCWMVEADYSCRFQGSTKLWIWIHTALVSWKPTIYTSTKRQLVCTRTSWSTRPWGDQQLKGGNKGLRIQRKGQRPRVWNAHSAMNKREHL